MLLSDKANIAAKGIRNFGKKIKNMNRKPEPEPTPELTMTPEYPYIAELKNLHVSSSDIREILSEKDLVYISIKKDKMSLPYKAVLPAGLWSFILKTFDSDDFGWVVAVPKYAYDDIIKVIQKNEILFDGFYTVDELMEKVATAEIAYNDAIEMVKKGGDMDC